MLKIKDNVDLKELEKFGYKPIMHLDGQWYEHYSCYMYGQYHSFYRETNMLIKEDSREIITKSALGGEILYDLIQAGLVEKE